MDMFDFEELLADMLDITDDQREEDDQIVEDALHSKYEMGMEEAFSFAQALLLHVPPVEAGLSGKPYHAFISKSGPFMLMKIEANPNPNPTE